jgi:hypothetical protein
MCVALSRSEARRVQLRHLLDANGINVKAHYIRSAASVWVDRLRGHLDNDDWQLDPVLFAELDSRYGPHNIDRFASALNMLLPRYNARWLDPTCEVLDALHLPDSQWFCENNWCNPRGPYYPTSYSNYVTVEHQLR